MTAVLCPVGLGRAGSVVRLVPQRAQLAAAASDPAPHFGQKIRPGSLTGAASRTPQDLQKIQPG